MKLGGRSLAILIIIGVALATLGVWWFMDQQTRVDETSVRIYADPMAENILETIDSGDLTNFTRDMDATMKAAYTPDQFATLQNLIHTKVGTYMGKTFTSAERSGEYIVVYYKATYSDEPAGVTVRVVFSVNTGGAAQVSGLWFSSPKLAS
jgi:hypothetical protein